MRFPYANRTTHRLLAKIVWYLYSTNWLNLIIKKHPTKKIVRCQGSVTFGNERSKHDSKSENYKNPSCSSN